MAGTYGEETITLAARAGLILEHWQRDAVTLCTAYRRDHQWACFEYAEIVARQNGKGSIVEARVLAGSQLFGERLIIWTAHQDRTVEQAFKRMSRLFDTLGLLRTAERPQGSIQAMLSNGKQALIDTRTGHEIKFMTRSKHAGRGFSCDLLIYDEAYALDDEEVAASVPTMSAMPNPQMIITSTPPLSGDTAQPLYSLRRRALKGAAIGLGYREWGLPGTLEDLARMSESEALALLSNRDNWAAANPAMGGRLTEGFTQYEFDRLARAAFARERLGMWPAQVVGGGDVDAEQWRGLLDAASRRVGEVACGIDISPQRDYAAIVVYGTRSDGLGHAQVIRYHPGTDWLITAITEATRVLKPVAWGMGPGTFKSLREDLAKIKITATATDKTPQRGEVCVVAGTDMAAACGQMLDAVRQRSLRHVGDTALDDAVEGAKLRQVGDVIAWARKQSAADISPLVALTLARWAYLTRIEAVTTPKPPRIPMAAFG